jgi:hypothetical protein
MTDQEAAGTTQERTSLMSISTVSNKAGEVEVTFDAFVGANLEEAIAKYGEPAVYSRYLSAIVIDFQAFARGILDRIPNQVKNGEGKGCKTKEEALQIISEDEWAALVEKGKQDVLDKIASYVPGVRRVAGAKDPLTKIMDILNKETDVAKKMALIEQMKAAAGLL